MGKYHLILQPTAAIDFAKHKKSGNKAIINKILKILTELEAHPYVGTGKPEPLKHNLQGYWSRRISMEHRIIYRVEEKEVVVIIFLAMGHYLDE